MAAEVIVKHRLYRAIYDAGTSVLTIQLRSDESTRLKTKWTTTGETDIAPGTARKELVDMVEDFVLNVLPAAPDEPGTYNRQGNV